MSFSFDETLEGDLDQVRFIIGDTDAGDPLLADETIEFLLTQQGSITAASVAACQGLIAKFARQVDTKLDTLSVSASDRAGHYQKLLDQLLADISIAVLPFAGGISVSDKRARENNTDRTQPAFTRELHEDPRLHPVPAGTQSWRDWS